MINKEKNIFQWWFVSAVQCHALKYFFPRMGFSSVLWVLPKKKFLLPKMVETFGKHLSNFPILRKQSTVLIFWLTPCLNMIWGVWVHFPKMPQYMSTCETGITQPTEGLDTWVRSHLMWNKEQNTLDSVQCVPAHDLGYLRPVSSNFPNICYLFNRDNPTYREPWHLSRSHLM